jgi:uncharacterized membrane protein YukC
MDTIDITSAEFSLGNLPHVGEAISNSLDIDISKMDYTLYIYIGIAILGLIIIVYLIYRFYIRKEKHVTFQEKLDECYGENRNK